MIDTIALARQAVLVGPSVAFTWTDKFLKLDANKPLIEQPSSVVRIRT